MVEVVAIRELSEEEALQWIRAQPNGRITLPPVELGRRWSWPRYRVTRRLKAWSIAGHVTRRGNTIMASDGAGQKAISEPATEKKQRLEKTTVLPGPGAAPVAAPDGAPETHLVAPFVAPQNTAPVAVQDSAAGAPVARVPWPRRTSRPLVVIAYGFFGLGVGINIWNAWTGGALTDMALPATLGVLAEGVVFFLPAWALALPVGRQVLAWALFVFVSVFALTNSLRMASIIAADQATTRADRQTEGVRTADRALETARIKRDEACGRGLGKTVACQARQVEVTKLENRQTQATGKVAAQAKPESGDFAKLVA